MGPALVDPEAKTLFFIDPIPADTYGRLLDRLESALDLFDDGSSMPDVLRTFPVYKLGKLNGVSFCLQRENPFKSRRPNAAGRDRVFEGKPGCACRLSSRACDDELCHLPFGIVTHIEILHTPTLSGFR
jgi:hypothetical protein